MIDRIIINRKKVWEQKLTAGKGMRASGLFIKFALKSFGATGPNKLSQRMEEDLVNGDILSADESEIET